jgi:hypothetical protein
LEVVMAGPWDDYGQSNNSGGEPWSEYGGQPDAPKSSGIARRLVGDTGISALKSAIAVPEAAVGIADLVTGGQAGKAAEQAGFRPKEAKAFLDDYLSPEQKAANAKLDQAEGFVDTLSTAIDNPSTIIHTGVESIAPMLAGGVVARGVMAAPGIAGKVAPWVAGAVGEGTVGAGMGAESIRQQTEDGLLTGEQAGLAALSGAGTSLIGAAGAKVANKLGIGEIDTLLAGGGAGQATGKGVARRAAEGAVVEGVLQELPQSVQETALQNIALDRPWDEGLGEAAAMGLLTGGALGGIAGPLGGKPLVQPQPSAENPAPTPVPAPDPNAGAISRTAALLPAPSIAGLLPAPESVMFADGQGNVSDQGPVRDVDREQRPIPGRAARTNGDGPGMDQQTPRGDLPLSGELIPAVQVPGGRQAAEPRTFEAEPVRQGIPDLRPEAVIVDSAGQASVGRLPTPVPTQAEPRRDGMEQQAKPGQRTTFEQVLLRARAGQLDPVALASESGATRSQAARAIRGVQAERQAVAEVYKSVPGARKALSRLPKADAFEVVKTGNREWRIQQRQEASSADSGQRVDDVRAAGDLPAAPAPVDNVARVPVVAERPAPAESAAEPGGSDIPAAVEGADGQPALTEQPEADKQTPAAQKPAKEQPALPEILATPRKRFISRQAKAAGIKKGSPGYDAAVGRLESEYERQVDDAQAALPFEQFNALNKESPEGVNRQAWTQLRKERGIENVEEPAAPKTKPVKSVKGADIDGDWASFSKGSGTLSIPRAEMPQIKAEHRGAMVNFLNARGVAHSEETIAADQLKPTQAEYSTKKVEAAKAFEGGDRSILISSDGHVLDGHHQWLAKRDAGEDVKVIRLDAPIRQLLDIVAEFPSATVDEASAPAASSAPKAPAAKIEDAGEKLGGARKDELRGVRERLADMDDEAIASSSLSELWPKDEINRIEDTFQAASYQTVREYIPAKPRVTYKLTGWVNKVKAAREIIGNLSEIGADATVAKMRKFSPGLRPIADKVELLMGIDRAQWGRIGRVSMASGSFSVEGKMTPGSWVEVQIDGRNKHFFGKNSIAEALDDVRSTLNLNSAPEKKMKFDVYTDRGTREVFIAKSGDRETRRLATFKTTSEARDYINNSHNSLVAAWDAVKNRDNVTKADMRRDLNEVRTGRDYRNGADITPDQLLETFGFRGVEFGNWVSQGSGNADRQGMLNQAYDAFMDLADVIGVPPKALSLEGRLGIGFGSRGRGRASAHFEPDTIVINLTKTKGAGSLAHEWFHAADNYFAGKRQDRAYGASRESSYITYRPEPMMVNTRYPSQKLTRAKLDIYQANHPNAPLYAEENWTTDPAHPNGVRPQVEKAFAELVETLDRSPMAKRAAVLDSGTSDGYWSRIIERGARSFETYVIAKLADQGYRNDYLANVRSLEEFSRNQDRYPYLTPDEQGPVSEAFDKLFATIETRVEADGNVAMYRLSPEQASGIPLFSARAIATKISKATGVQVETVANEAGLPAAVQAQIKRDGVSGRVAGVYHNGTSYLIASNLRDTKHAISTVLHEAVGHGGVKAVLGSRINPVMRGIYRDMPAAMKRELERRYAGQTAGMSTFDAQVLIAEEYVAHLAETDPKNGVIDRLVAMLRQFIRSTFGDTAALKWTRNDLVQLLAEARQAASNGGEAARYRESTGAEALAALPEVSEASEAEFVESLSDEQASTFARAIYKARGTDSPFFQRWFGKSRMIDKQGQPVAFVHRSYGERDTFDDADLGKNTGTPTATLGHFLARKDVGNVDRYGPVVEQFYIRMAKPKVVTQQQFEAMGDWSLAKVQAYRKTLMDQGYDGMYIQGLAWPVVFEGKNIKAKRNSGTFNESASTRYNVNDQTKTPAFVRWFGDWQAARAEARLDAMRPITIQTPAEWRGLPLADLRRRVEASLQELGDSSKPLQHPEIGEVKIVKRGIGKALSASADPAKLLVLGDLRKAFEGSIYASSQPAENKPNVMGYDKLLARVNIDGQELVAVLTVETLRNGQQFYNAVTLNDGQKKAPVASPRDTPIAGERATSANTGTTNFVRRELERVNQDTVSKVVDADGRPLVVYHGTTADFSKFSSEFMGDGDGRLDWGEGFYFTDRADAASGYAGGDGGNVMPVFLNIKNPATNKVMLSPEVQDALGDDMGFEDLSSLLESQGYDGVEFTHRDGAKEYVAFRSEQIKSATGNNGDFDPANPDIRYSLNDDAATTDALRKLGLGGKDADGILEQIRGMTLGGLKAKLADWSTRSEEGLFDGLAGIRRAEEAVGVTDADQQGYVSARMATGIADVMHGVLHYAAPEWRDGVIAGKDDTRGVLEILGDLGQNNLTPWLAWLGGKRAQMLKAQGRENNLTDTDIAELLAMGKGKEALFEKVYKDYAKINEAVLDLAEQAGLIDQSARAKWATEYYVPFYRVDESEGLFSGPRSKKGLSHQSAAIKALKGGTLPTNDLLTNMLQGWTKRIDASMKNKALMEVVDNLQGSEYLTDESPRYQQVLISRSQIADQIRKDRKALAMAAEMLGLPAESKFLKVANQLMKPENDGFEQLWTRVAPTDPDIIRLQRGGKNEYYRVNDESLLRGLKFMEGSVFNDPITRIGRTFKRLLTTGVTASPDFILRNFIRDAAHAWMINKDGFVLGKDSIKGMRDALREDQDYRDLMFAGGSFQGGYVHGTDPEASAQIIRRALEKKGFTSEQQSAYMGSLVNTPAKVAGMLGKGWQAYRTLGDKVENANRLSTYKAAIAAGKSPRQAAYEAKDLMDYSMRGNFAAAQWFTDVVPFLNARLQGLYKLGRAVKGDKTLLAKEVAMKGAYIAMFSLLLAGLNDDDERYQALMDWDKDMHWHIFLGDQHFRIPKPFELGLVFGTVPERLLHALTGTQDGGDLAKAVSQGVFQTLAFNPVPQFYQPIRELQANRNFFRDSPIEDMSDEGKLPEARFDERTSALGRALGQITGPTLGLSPKQLDHLVQGYTGTLGGYVLAMSSLIAGAFDGVDSPTSRAGDLPILKVLYQGDDVRSTQYQSQFYDMMQEADQLHRTVKAYRDEGKVEAAGKLMENSKDKLKHRAALGLARQQLGYVRKQMDAVYRDAAMDGAMKRRRLDELQTRSNMIAERVVRMAGKDF